MADNRKYANVRSTIIQAMLNDGYIFKSKKDGEDFLKNIQKKYISSKHSKLFSTGYRLYIWIHGYEVTNQEVEQNSIGNYCSFHIIKKNDNWGIEYKKVEVDVRKHPKKKNVKQSHPNWSEPILKDFKKGRVFGTLELASKKFDKLIMEYPQACIPNENKLYLMVYEANSKTNEKGVVKYIFEIEMNPDKEIGGYIVTHRLNEYSKNDNLVHSKPQEQKEELGYFTSLIKLKKRKKKSFTSNN